MPQHYLLACPTCHTKLSVEPSQAGEVLVCSCGAQVTAPTFREIKQLEPVADDQPQRATPAKWSRLQGVMFSLGILVLILGLLLGFFPFMRRTNIAPAMEAPPPPDMTIVESAIDDLSPAESLDVWDKLLERGVNREREPLHIALREVAGKLNLMITIAAVLVVLGLGSAIGAFLVKPTR